MTVLFAFLFVSQLYRGCQHERIQLWKERIGLKTSSSPGENIGAQSAVLYRSNKKSDSRQLPNISKEMAEEIALAF